MKKFIIFVITLLVLIGINFGFAYVTRTNFIDYDFIIELAVTIIIWKSGTKGGFTFGLDSWFLNSEAKEMMDHRRFSPGIAFTPLYFIPL